MHHRSLGNTGIKVSEIGMGCNRLGEEHQPDSHWIKLVHHALDLGINVFDTSESYGWGRSEEILGQAIGNRDDLYIASKVSRIRETNVRDLTPARIIERHEASLRKLRRDCIDIYQLHTPSLEALQSFDWIAAMLKLKEQGKIRVIGVSIIDAASGQWLLEQGLCELFQVAYNMAAPQVGDALFPQSKKQGVGILVRVPMAQGILTGKFRPGEPVAKGHRAHRAGDKMTERIAQAEKFRAIAEEQKITVAQLALRYALNPEAVSALIPGARTIEQLTQNAAASTGKRLDDEVMEAIADTQRSL